MKHVLRELTICYPRLQRYALRIVLSPPSCKGHPLGVMTRMMTNEAVAIKPRSLKSYPSSARFSFSIASRTSADCLSQRRYNNSLRFGIEKRCRCLIQATNSSLVISSRMSFFTVCLLMRAPGPPVTGRYIKEGHGLVGNHSVSYSN